MKAMIRNEDGFTVLELLVSLTLMALITAHLSGALYQSRKIAEVQARASDRLERLFTRGYLAGSLTNIQSVFEVRGDGPAVLAFDGTAEAIAFIAVNDSRLDRGGLYRHTLSLNEDRDNRALVLSRRLFRPAAKDRGGAGDAGQSRALLDGLSGVRIRYFGQRTGEAAAGWHDSWSGEKMLPRMIEIRVTYADARRNSLPPLTVRLANAN